MIINKNILIKNIYYMLSYAFQTLNDNAYNKIETEDFATRYCGLAEKVWQYFVVIPDIKSVGVKDDSRYEGWPAIIRAVNTVDAMTASIEEIPYAVLHKITARITNEVDGINRVLYDLTPKPSGTIEWE